MLMTPGLAFFYGGMVRSKSVLNMLMMNFMCLAIVGVLWCLYGFSLAFGNDSFAGLVGNFQYLGLGNTFPNGSQAIVGGSTGDGIPILAFVMFQLMFAVITPALISGAVPERIKFWSWGLFVVLWSTIVYFPVAHWVFAFDGYSAEKGGWIANSLKALDFAGGTAVHINAGAAGLALALVLGKRRNWPRDPGRPHSLPFVLLGASLLWFGWYGFNAGSALGANSTAAVAFTTTTVATAAATIGWLIVEQLRDGKPTTLGAASGAVAGLVAITPACAYVNPVGALAIGVIAGSVCALCVSIKFRLGFDQPGKQAVAAFSGLLYSFIVTSILALLIKHTIGFRVSDENEAAGIDESEHAESGYDYSGLSGGGNASLLGAGAAGTSMPATPREGAPR